MILKWDLLIICWIFTHIILIIVRSCNLYFLGLMMLKSQGYYQPLHSFFDSSGSLSWKCWKIIVIVREKIVCLTYFFYWKLLYLHDHIHQEIKRMVLVGLYKSSIAISDVKFFLLFLKLLLRLLIFWKTEIFHSIRLGNNTPCSSHASDKSNKWINSSIILNLLPVWLVLYSILS